MSSRPTLLALMLVPVLRAVTCGFDTDNPTAEVSTAGDSATYSDVEPTEYADAARRHRRGHQNDDRRATAS
ncbi:hypothetical protein [Euzebya rosea]|uniref:hypothetical protein n=1 Tax=Euzebya rosea TaxID=2052804 RepID=UPI0013004F18|nr:hypothetical protein [Euzebya rosea]